jgi:hypothetical protein
MSVEGKGMKIESKKCNQHVSTDMWHNYPILHTGVKCMVSAFKWSLVVLIILNISGGFAFKRVVLGTVLIILWTLIFSILEICWPRFFMMINFFRWPVGIYELEKDKKIQGILLYDLTLNCCDVDWIVLCCKLWDLLKKLVQALVI